MYRLGQHFGVSRPPELPRPAILCAASLTFSDQISHKYAMFNDNRDGTLTMTGRGFDKLWLGNCCIVSQIPLAEDAAPPVPPTLPDKKRKARARDTSSQVQRHSQSTRSHDSEPPNIPVAKQGQQASKDPAELLSMNAPDPHLARVLETSQIWEHVQPLLNRNRLKSYYTAKKHEQKAFRQAISLPKMNHIDKDWVKGVQRSNQRAFKALLSLVLHFAGCKRLCAACETRGAEKQQNCMVLPPEAMKMAELRLTLGNQCVNCYFYPTSRPCGLSFDLSFEAKKTSVPAPQPPPQVIPERSSGAATTLPSRDNSRHVFKASAVPRTPVPVPLIPKSSVPRLSSMSQPSGAQVYVERTGLNTNGEAEASQTNLPSTANQDSAPGDTIHSNSARDCASSDEVVSKSDTGSSEAQSPPTSVDPAIRPDAMSSSMLSKTFDLASEVGKLPMAQQAAAYENIFRIFETVQIVRRAPLPAAHLTRTSPGGHSQPSPVGDDWEMAPGHLAPPSGPDRDDGLTPSVAFSDPFLRRMVVGFELAYPHNRTHKVLNKHIQPRGSIRIEETPDDWDCTVSVLEGMIRVNMLGIDAKIGQGGLLKVPSGAECIVANVMDQESRIQVWWMRADF